MIAVANLIPSDPDEQRTVRSILDANPQVRSFIVRASAKAEELFPGATIRLDAVQYDEWDPPLQLVILIPLSWDDYIQQREIYLAWISAQRDLDLDLILPLPGVERADGRPALIRGRELLAVADLLAAQHDEAFQRSAISRSYYAAYLEARSLCEDHLGFVRTARGAEHQDVPRLVGTIDFDLRTHLSILRRLRNAADYDTDLSNETMRRSARDARSYADVILIGLDRIRASLESEAPADRPQEP